MKPSEISTTQDRSKYVQSYSDFAQLCESIINEDSTIISMLRNQPKGIELARLLHRKMNLPHNVVFKKVNKVSVGRPESDYSFEYGRKSKKTRGSRWSIIVGAKGVAAVHYSFNTQKYTAIVPNVPDNIDQENELQSKFFKGYRSEKWTEVKRILKIAIGEIKEIYEVQDPNLTAGLKKERASRKKNTALNEPNLDQTVDFLFKKFTPIFLRTLESAEAEYRGILNIMLKAGSYKNMNTYVEKLQKLEETIDQIRNPLIGLSVFLSRDSELKTKLKNAIYLTAQHYYPELTQGLAKTWGRIAVGSEAGAQQIINEIAKGDTKKLATILGFFKNEMMQL